MGVGPRLALVGGLGLFASACAPILRVYQGDLLGDPLDLRARLVLAESTTTVHVRLDNNGEEPLAVDFDVALLRDGANSSVSGDQRALGRPLAATGKEPAHGAPIGTLTIDPHASTEVDLAFARRPGSLHPVLVLPAAFRLGIEGPKPLARIELPLAFDTSASRAADRAAFYDPFVAD